MNPKLALDGEPPRPVSPCGVWGVEPECPDPDPGAELHPLQPQEPRPPLQPPCRASTSSRWVNSSKAVIMKPIEAHDGRLALQSSVVAPSLPHRALGWGSSCAGQARKQETHLRLSPQSSVYPWRREGKGSLRPWVPLLALAPK